MAETSITHVEQWRAVPGWEGLYEVSSWGRIKSLARDAHSSSRRGKAFISRRPERLMKPMTAAPDRWPRIRLRRHNDRSGSLYPLASLVLSAFRGAEAATKAFRFANNDPTDCSLMNIAVIDQEQEGETWRPVVGWNGLYEVSSLGRVRSLPRRTTHGSGASTRKVRGRVLAGRPSSGMRYVGVSLTDGERVQNAPIHILVCEAFHGPRPDGHVACHRDDNPANNSAANMYWGTRSDNWRDFIVNEFARLHEMSREQAESAVRTIKKEDYG